MERLADHVDLLTGFPFKSASYSNDLDAVRLVRGDNVVQGRMRWENAKLWPSEITVEIQRYRLHVGDVVLAMDRPWIEAGLKYARITQDDVPSLLVQRVARLRATSGLDQGYLFYLIGSREFTNHVLAIQTGTAVPHISGGQILEFRFRLPPLSEQRRIAEVLGAMDDKIEENRRTGRALERLARAIFRSWFVECEPVKAKGAGATSFPSISQDIFTEVPIDFVDSELGPIPREWKLGVVGDAATLSKIQVKPQLHPEEVFDHFSIPAYDSGQNAVGEQGNSIKSNKFLVVDACLLISKLNPRILRVWLPPATSSRRQIASTEFLVTMPREGWDRDYLFCQFKQPEFCDDLAQGASGTSNSHQRVRPQDFLAKAIVLAPVELRDAFRQHVGPMMELSGLLNSESRKLAEMRDLLLSKLLSAAVRIRGTTTEHSFLAPSGEHV